MRREAEKERAAAGWYSYSDGHLIRARAMLAQSDVPLLHNTASNVHGFSNKEKKQKISIKWIM